MTMQILSKMRKQTAVRWPVSGVNAYGKNTWTAAVEIRCRWEDIAIEYIDPKGTTQLSKSRVYAGIDLSVGDVLYLGRLTDLTDLTDPKENDGAFEVKQFDKLPTLKNDGNLRTAYL